MDHHNTSLLRRSLLILFVGALTAGLGPSQTLSAQDVQDATETEETAKPVLKDYVGSFGGRVFSIERESLTFTNDHMPVPVSMAYLGDDEFEVIIPPGAQVRGPAGGGIPTFLFNRNEEGLVVSLSLVNTDGVVVSTYERDGD